MSLSYEFLVKSTHLLYIYILITALAYARNKVVMDQLISFHKSNSKRKE